MNRREALKRTALLLGMAVSPSGIASAMAAATRDPSAGPAHLSAAQFATATALAECILPRTDTPGARDAGVPQFIDLSYGRFMTSAERSSLAAGLAAIDVDIRQARAAPFAGLPADQQAARLQAFVEAATGENRTFLRQFREATFLGYFTSEIVATTVLKYDPVPMRYEADIPLSETGGIAWGE